MKKIALIFLFICGSAFSREVVISIAAGQQVSPDVATDGTNYLVVWEDARAGTGNLNVYCRAVNSDGSTPGYESPISTAVNHQKIPAIDWDSATNRYLAVWSDQRTAGTYKLFGNYLGAEGALIGDNFEIAIASGVIQRIDVASSGVGRFLIVWEERVSGISAVKACVVQDGSITMPIALSATSANQKNPSIATRGDGWIVVFDDTTGTARGIFAVKILSSGTLDGTAYLLTSSTGNESSPSIAKGSDGYMVVFERQGATTDRDVFAIRLNNAGDAIGIPFPVSMAISNQTRPEISFDGVGYLVVWQDTRSGTADIYGQRISPGGTLDGLEFVVCDADNAQQKPKIISNRTNHLAVWEDSRGATSDIYGETISGSTGPSGPVATILEPLPLLKTSCSRNPVKMLLTDPDGVDLYSIRFVARGDTFNAYSSHILMVGDTMRFNPPSDWRSGDSSRVTLLDAADLLGNHISAPVSWKFFADLDAPVPSNEIPRNGTTIPSFPTTISINLTDALSGVDPTNTIFIFNADTFRIGSYLSWDGYTLTLRPPSGGTGTHTCRVIAPDRPDYCAPNIASYSWNFFVDAGGGPVANPIRPRNGDVAGSATPQISIKIFDASGVDETTIRLSVEGTLYTWPSAYMTFADTLLVFTPPSPYSHAQVVDVSLLHVADDYGNPMSAPLVYSFAVDIRPPVLGPYFPRENDTLRVGLHDVWIIARDAPAGIIADPMHVRFRFYDLTMTLLESPSSGITMRGDTIYQQSGSFGSSLGNNRYIRICAQISDAPNCFGMNTADTCWNVFVEQTGIEDIPIPNNEYLKIIPNPFNAGCVIFSDSPSIEVFDIDGRLVSILRNDKRCFFWNGTDIAGTQVKSGLYLFRETNTGKISKGILIK